MQGKFSDTSYFLLRDFFKEIHNSKYKDKPIFDYKWDVTFVSTITNGSSVEYIDDPFTFFDSDSTNNIIYTNFDNNIFNLEYHYNPNTIQTSNSYIVSPFINITTHGNGIVNLFVKEYDDGYLPITLKYINTKDDRFNFYTNAGNSVVPGDEIINTLNGYNYIFNIYNTTIRGESAVSFNNNREAYWRKDSLFHAWLKKYAHDYYLDKWGVDLNIRNYVNYDKIFLLFHKIFKSHDEKTCRIIFYGMKNFVMDAIPEHQRTPKFKEFMDIFFDELYQEGYNLLKDIWSLNDPMEVNRKYIGYLSKFYDMFDVDNINIPELHLREFVRDMIWILKRKGTYTDFFILWRVLTNTRNRLNIYERWHVKNVSQWPQWPQNINPNDVNTWPNWPYYYDDNTALTSTNVPTSAWYDTIYTFKPEYEQSPITGGAGDLWYRNNYPMTIEACLNDMAAEITYVREGAFVYTKYETDSNIWYISHNLGHKNVLVQTFDDEFNEMYPLEIFYMDDNTISITFPENIRGYAFIKEDDLSVDRTLFASSEWDIYTDFDNQNVIINFSNNDRKLIEKDTWLKDNNNVIAYETIRSNTFYQNVPSDTWNIEHNMDSDIIIQVFDIDFEEIIPSDIDYVSSNLVSINFDIPVSGFVIMKKVDDSDTQDPISGTWIINNTLNQKELIIDFDEDDSKVLESSLELLNDTESKAGFSSNNIIERKANIASANIVHIQNIPSNIWIINHSLSSRNILVSIYDLDNKKIIPSDYRVISNNQIELIFDNNQDGYAVIVKSDDSTIDIDRLKKAFMLSADFKHEQLTDSIEWRIPYTEDIKGFIANVYTWDNIKINPGEYNMLSDGDYITIKFKYPTSGYVLLEEICSFIDVREDKKMMLSTHYIVEIDINDEPMDYHSILSKNTWNNTSLYWDYLRPVNRVVDYRIVLAPITDFSGRYVSLYDNSYNSDAFLLSKNEYYSGIEQGAYIYTQTVSSSAWIINHNLGDHIHIQVFDTEFNEVVPYEVIFDSLSVLRLLFRQPFNGFAMMKRSKEYKIQDPITNVWNINNSLNQKELVINFAENNRKIYEKSLKMIDIASSEATFNGDVDRDVVISITDYKYTQTTPSNVWNIYHTLYTKSLSVQIYDENKNRIIPLNCKIIDSNNIQVTFEENVIGDAMIVKSSTYLFSTLSKEWIINHNLNSYVNTQVFDNNFDEIVPSKVQKDLNSIRVLFDEPMTGYISINKPDEYQQQMFINNEWIIDTTINNEDAIVNFFENNKEVYESSLELVDNDSIDSTFSTNVSQSEIVFRDEVTSDGNYVFFQNTPSKTWNVNHNVGARGWLSNVYDMDDNRIHPSEYRLTDASNLTLEFNKETDGYVVLLKVGNLSLDGFDFDNAIIKVFENVGDMANSVTPLYTDTIDRVIESNNMYYIENTIPKEYEFTFNEVGIFHRNGSLLFYTKCSDVYKPKDVLFIIHYRIEKRI